MSRKHPRHFDYRETLGWLVGQMGMPVVVHLHFPWTSVPVATMAGFLAGAEIAGDDDLLQGVDGWDGVMAFRLVLDTDQDPAEAHCRFLLASERFERAVWFEKPDPHLSLLLDGYRLEFRTQTGFSVVP